MPGLFERTRALMAAELYAKESPRTHLLPPTLSFREQVSTEHGPRTTHLPVPAPAYREQLLTDQGLPQHVRTAKSSLAELLPEADGFEDESDGPEESANAWEANPTGGTGKVEIRHVVTGKVYLVARAQMTKAMKALDPASCLSALGEACGCSKACNMQFSSVAVLRARASIHTLADEQAKSTALAAYMHEDRPVW